MLFIDNQATRWGGLLPRGFSGIPPGTPLPQFRDPRICRTVLSLAQHRGMEYQPPSPKCCSGADVPCPLGPWEPWHRHSGQLWEGLG